MKKDERPVVAEATLKYHRGSAQKARLVLDQIRDRNVNDALALLRFSPKEASRPVEKLLRSAVANAERSEEKVDVDTLYVAEAYAGPGPSLKRFRGRAFGRAFRILHRTCHVTLKLKSKAAHEPAPARRETGPEAGETGAQPGGGKAATRRRAPARSKSKPGAAASGGQA